LVRAVKGRTDRPVDISVKVEIASHHGHRLQHAGCGFATDDDAEYPGKEMIVSTVAIQSVVRRPGRAAIMPIVCRDIGGEPYGDECDNRSLSGHALN
jgi:hypothetical protein